MQVSSSGEAGRKSFQKTKTSSRSSRSHIYDYVKDEEKVMYGFFGAVASDSDDGSPGKEQDHKFGAGKSPFQGEGEVVDCDGDSDFSFDSVADAGIDENPKDPMDRRRSASFEARRLQNELRSMLRAAFSEHNFAENLTPVHHNTRNVGFEDENRRSGPNKYHQDVEPSVNECSQRNDTDLLETMRRLSLKEAEANAALSQALEDNAALREELIHWRIVNKEAAMARRAARDALGQVSTENARLQAANNAQKLEIRALNDKIRLQRSRIDDLECLLAASESQREAYAEALATATLASPKQPPSFGFASEASSKSKQSRASSSGDIERQELLSLLERLQEELAKSSHAVQHDKASSQNGQGNCRMTENKPPSTPVASPSPSPFLSKPTPAHPSRSSTKEERTPDSLRTPVAPPLSQQGDTPQRMKRQVSTAPPAVPLGRQHDPQTSPQASLAIERVRDLKSAAERAVSCKKYNEAIEKYTAGLQSLQENPMSNSSKDGTNVVNDDAPKQGFDDAKILEDLLCGRASALKEVGRLLDSAADCCRVLSTHPSCLQARLVRAETYFQMDAFDVAADDFEYILKRRSVGLSRHQVMGMTSKLRYARSAISNSAPRNHYAVLGLKHTANSSEIKKAYRQLALKLHPDKAAALMGSQYATCLFALLSSAYATLSNSKSRQQYDASYSVRRAFSPFGGQHKGHSPPAWRTR